MRRLLYVVVLFLPMCSFAQRQNDIWYFGEGAGLSFASGTATPILGPISTQEGTASVCDPTTGRLLFTTDGLRIYDRNLSPMPNGTGLEGGWSSTQSAIIFPQPGASGKYYVFTAGDLSKSDTNLLNPGLHYNIVDMALNGGNGDVAIKNVRLLDSCAEKLHATMHCDGESYWVVAHHIERPRFYMFKVTPRGVEPPVVSDIGIQYVIADQRVPGRNYGIGMAKFSASGRMVAIANPHSKLCEMFDVDLRTGLISNPRIVDTARPFYGMSFSPSEAILYVTTWNQVLQYDLTTDSITQTRVIVGDIRSYTATSFRGGIQRGPDGVIYVADSSGLKRIPFPDARGPACGYDSISALMLRAPTFTRIGLSNIIDGQYSTPPIAKCPRADFTCATVACARSFVSFVNYSSSSVTAWSWQFPGGTPNAYEGLTPPLIHYDAVGTSVVRLIASNIYGADTMYRSIRIVALPTIIAGVDFNFCNAEAARLQASGGVRYAWSPAYAVSDATIADPTITATQTTTFVVTGWNDDGCAAVDTVVAEFFEPAALIMNNVQCYVSKSAAFVVQHPPGEFDSCDVSLRYNGGCMSGVTVSVGEELERGSMPDGRNFIRMRLRKLPTDNIIATVIGIAMLQPVRYDELECLVEASYGCREVSSTEATLEFRGCALDLRNIKVSSSTMLMRTIYDVDGRIVHADEVQYNRWEEQPTMSTSTPAGLYIEVLSVNGSPVHRRLFTRSAE